MKELDSASPSSGRDGAPLGLDPPRRGLAMVLMVLCSVVISFAGLIMRSIEGADPWQINFYRSMTLVFAVTFILLVRYRRRTLAAVRGVGRIGLLGGALLAAAGLAFLQSLNSTTVANTLFMLSAIPFITAGLARIFLKERLERATLVTMAVASAGVFVMLVESIGIGSAYGNAMGLLTAVCFSTFAVIVRRNRRVDMLPTLLVSGAIIVLVAGAARLGDLGISPRDLLLCLVWGGFLSGFANWMFIFASRHLAAAEVTLFMLLEFALGPLWVWLFVGEVPSPWTLVGGPLVILSVAARAAIELGRSNRTRRRGGLPSPS